MKTNNRGFTLVELMVTVAIIGVLGAIAYPSFTAHTEKAKCTDGTGPLLTLAGRMEEFYLNSDSYSTADVSALMGSNQSPKGLYEIEITTANNFTYTLTATPDDTDQNTLTLNSLGVKTETGGTAGVAATCWK